MLLRSCLLFAALASSLATTGCSSLTRPDPIQIAAEPAPAPQIRELPAGPARPGGARGAAAPHPPGSGG